MECDRFSREMIYYRNMNGYYKNIRMKWEGY